MNRRIMQLVLATTYILFVAALFLDYDISYRNTNGGLREGNMLMRWFAFQIGNDAFIVSAVLEIAFYTSVALGFRTTEREMLLVSILLGTLAFSHYFAGYGAWIVSGYR